MLQTPNQASLQVVGAATSCKKRYDNIKGQTATATMLYKRNAESLSSLNDQKSCRSACLSHWL